jgi:hypothetical protein
MLQVNIHKYAPSLSPGLLLDVQNNANAVFHDVPPALRADVLYAYVKTLSAVYLLGVPCSILALIGALCMTNVTMEHAAEEAAVRKEKKERELGDASSVASSRGARADAEKPAVAEDDESRKDAVPDVERQ